MSDEFQFTQRSARELHRAHHLALSFAEEARQDTGGDVASGESADLARGSNEESDWGTLCYHVAHSVAVAMPLASDGRVLERAREVLSRVRVDTEPRPLREYQVAVKLPAGEIVLGVTAPGPAEAGNAALDGLVSLGADRDGMSVSSAWRKGARQFYTIARGDVGRSFIRAFGKSWPVSDFLGSVFPDDVGKRVYLYENAATDYKYLQPENDQQRAARIARGGE